MVTEIVLYCSVSAILFCSFLPTFFIKNKNCIAHVEMTS